MAARCPTARAPVLDPVFSLRDPAAAARQRQRAGGVQHADRADPRTAAGLVRQVPRPIRLRARRRSGLDARAGAAARSRGVGRGCQPVPASGRRAAVRQSRSAPAFPRAGARRRQRARALGARHLGRSPDPAAARGRRRRARDHPPAAAGTRVLAHQAARCRSGRPEREADDLCAGPAGRARRRWCARVPRRMSPMAGCAAACSCSAPRC